MAIQKDGEPCSEPDNPLMQTFLGGGKLGAISLARTMFELDVDVFTPFTFTVDQAAGYFRQETGGEFAFNPFFALPPAGACTAYARSGNLLTGAPIPFVPAIGLDAGDLALNGPNGAAELLRTVMGDSTDYDPTVVGGPEGISEAQDAPLYLSPGNYGVTGEGGADIGAINADADVSDPPQWTNSGVFTEVPRGNDVTFTSVRAGRGSGCRCRGERRQAQQRFGDVSVSSPGGLVQLPRAHRRSGQSSRLPLDSRPVGRLPHPRVMAHGHTRGLHCRRPRSRRRNVPVDPFQNGPIPLGGGCPAKEKIWQTRKNPATFSQC